MIVRITLCPADLGTRGKHSVALTFPFNVWANKVSVQADTGAFQDRAPGRFWGIIHLRQKPLRYSAGFCLAQGAV